MDRHADPPASDQARRLAAELDRVLEPLVAPGLRCALVGWPDHGNVGDNAIWVATLDWLRRRGAEVLYRGGVTAYDASELGRRLGGGTVLLSGGGNLGDVWPADQALRERVVRDFPANRIVQLPQTIRFRDGGDVDRVARAFARHPDLTILVRDRRSLELARSAFPGTGAALCPDMAMALGPRPRPVPPATDVVWVTRAPSDPEAVPGPPGVGTSSAEVRDWVARAPGPSAARLALRAAAPVRLAPRGRLGPVPGSAALGHAAFAAATAVGARMRVRRGLHLLSRARVVVTERLHGHLLCELLGIPHVAVDTRFGKIGDAVATWGASRELLAVVATRAEAADRARDFVDHGR